MPTSLDNIAQRLGLDRLAYRLWRYSPSGLVRLYQHLRFDRHFGVNTSGYSDLRYEPTPAPMFEEMLHHLPINIEEYVFVDFGSGKGKVVLMASRFPFKKVIGVELWDDLHRIAEENIRRYQSEVRNCTEMVSVCVDATSFRIPKEPTVFYFFNPFGEETLVSVLDNIESSLVEHPRRIYLIFYAPVRRGAPWDRHRILSRARCLERIEDMGKYTIYSNWCDTPA